MYASSSFSHPPRSPPRTRSLSQGSEEVPFDDVTVGDLAGDSCHAMGGVGSPGAGLRGRAIPVFRFSSSEHDNEYGGSPQGHSFHSMDPTEMARSTGRQHGSFNCLSMLAEESGLPSAGYAAGGGGGGGALPSTSSVAASAEATAGLFGSVPVSIGGRAEAMPADCWPVVHQRMSPHGLRQCPQTVAPQVRQSVTTRPCIYAALWSADQT